MLLLEEKLLEEYNKLLSQLKIPICLKNFVQRNISNPSDCVDIYSYRKYRINCSLSLTVY